MSPTLWYEGVSLPTGNGGMARKESPDSTPRFDVHVPGNRFIVVLDVLVGVAACSCGRQDCEHHQAVMAALRQRTRRHYEARVERDGAAARS